MPIIDTKAHAYGMLLKSCVRTVENPKELIMVGRKAPVDARIVVLAAERKARKYVLGSVRLRRICDAWNLAPASFSSDFDI